MRHIFIINPKSGQGKVQKKLMQDLTRLSLEFYLTKSSNDAEEYIKNLCRANPTEIIRFYACGGDGTLNLVLNGVVGFENAEVAVVPMGSGNDFIRNFDIPFETFRDIDSQIAGTAKAFDIIKYQDTAKSCDARYAFNMCNIGFDCHVVVNTTRFKGLPLVNGAIAYFLSILFTLIKKEGAELIVDFKDGSSYDGKVLFTAMGNGAYCGSGIKGLPKAELDDDLLDICVVKDVPRRTIFSLWPKYAKGLHLEDDKAKPILVYKKCKSIIVKNYKDSWFMSVDGEIMTITSEDVCFETMPKAVKFSLPNVD